MSEKGISYDNLKQFKEQYDILVLKKINDIVSKNTVDMSEYAKKSDIVSIARYKGAKQTYAELQEEAKELGDIWNIVEADEGNNINAGDNLIWNGEDWDNLSGMIDLSKFASKAETEKLTSDLETVQQAVDNVTVEYASSDDISALFYTKKSMVSNESLGSIFGITATAAGNMHSTIDMYVSQDGSQVATINSSESSYTDGTNANKTLFSFNISDGTNTATVDISYGDIINFAEMQPDSEGWVYVTNPSGNIVEVGPEHSSAIQMSPNNLGVLADKINAAVKDIEYVIVASYADGVFTLTNLDGGDIIISNVEGSKIDVAGKLNLQ